MFYLVKERGLKLTSFTKYVLRYEIIKILSSRVVEFLPQWFFNLIEAIRSLI